MFFIKINYELLYRCIVVVSKKLIFSAKKFGYLSEDPVDQLKAEMYMETQQVICDYHIYFPFTEVIIIKGLRILVEKKRECQNWKISSFDSKTFG